MISTAAFSKGDPNLAGLGGNLRPETDFRINQKYIPFLLERISIWQKYGLPLVSVSNKQLCFDRHLLNVGKSYETITESSVVFSFCTSRERPLFIEEARSRCSVVGRYNAVCLGFVVDCLRKGTGN